MRLPVIVAASALFAVASRSPLAAQATPPADSADPIVSLVGELDLERYKATIKGLTQFGDRRQGTERNRKAADWIEAQLKSYGCPTGRIKYEFKPPAPKPAPTAPRRGDRTCRSGPAAG